MAYVIFIYDCIERPTLRACRLIPSASCMRYQGLSFCLLPRRTQETVKSSCWTATEMIQLLMHQEKSSKGTARLSQWSESLRNLHCGHHIQSTALGCLSLPTADTKLLLHLPLLSWRRQIWHHRQQWTTLQILRVCIYTCPRELWVVGVRSVPNAEGWGRMLILSLVVVGNSTANPSSWIWRAYDWRSCVVSFLIYTICGISSKGAISLTQVQHVTFRNNLCTYKLSWHEIDVEAWSIHIKGFENLSIVSWKCVYTKLRYLFLAQKSTKERCSVDKCYGGLSSTNREFELHWTCWPQRSSEVAFRDWAFSGSSCLARCQLSDQYLDDIAR